MTNLDIQSTLISMRRLLISLPLACVILSAGLYSQPFPQGTIAADFTLKDRRTGEDVTLSDFEDHVIVLDFFAYWCAPCAFSSPDIEQNIQQFYEEQSGNLGGVPVQVIAVNIEAGNPDLTDDFIAQTELDLVVDDPDAVAWSLFNQVNGIPLFVVINGVKNSPSHEQWEVLHNAPSYPGSDFFKEIINSIEPAPVSIDPVESAVDIGEGWKWIDFFGSYQANMFPWVFHEQHGWIYFGEGNLNTGQFLLDITLGWVWTNRSVYPYLYSVDRNSWLRYEEETTAPRILKDIAINQDLEVFNASPDDPFFNGFNLGNVQIPLNEIISGGPSKDGIPSLTNPGFIPINEADFMVNSDILIAVTSGGITRGYPFRILNWHELVNDHIGDDYFLVTYCPLCGTAIVFESEVNGISRNFGVSGMLFLNNVLMYDRETESLWSQFMNQAVSGTMQQIRLKWKLSEQITWSNFKAKYPSAQVLSDVTGHNRRYDIDPYADYFASDGPLFRSSNPVRDDLPEKEWVWGITADDVAKAYPLARLTNGIP